MTTDLCPHDLDRIACVTCRNGPRPGRVRDRGVGPIFTARYRTACACGEAIHPGDDVRRYNRETMHARCAERLAW